MQKAIKRGLDIVLSALGLVLGAPLFLLAAVLVRVGSPGPIFFVQPRTGRSGKEFQIWKFRTMTTDAKLVTHDDGSARVDAGDLRLTRFGRLLREFGVDELPQLWNVLRGEMSLVGPRPYMPVHTSLTPEWARRRIEVRPGLVCLPEILGRNSLSWERRLQLDMHYVDNWSLWVDAGILLRTIPVVVLRKGVYTTTGSADTSSSRTNRNGAGQ